MHDLTPVVLVTGLSHTEAARLAEVCCSLCRMACIVMQLLMYPQHTRATCSMCVCAKLVAKLGGRMATSPQSCSHLVAPAVIRTVKFLTAFSIAKHVVRSEWIEKSVQHGQFLGELLCVHTLLTT